MKHSFRYAAFALFVPFVAGAYMACSSDDPSGTSDAGTSPTSTTTPTTPTPSNTTPTPQPDGSTSPDGSTPQPDSGCVYNPPNVDGGGVCGTYAFGTPAANASVPVDGGAYTGGAIPPGVYDVTLYERNSSQTGSWRETLALDGTRFTRIRQVDTGSGGAPVTYRSGTYTQTDAGGLLLTFDCAFDGDAGSDSGSNTIPYEVVKNGCADTTFRYGGTGIRTTLKRRP